MRTPLRLLLVPVLLLVACPAPPDLYHAVAPPDGEVPAALAGDRWVTHFREDIAPYWTQPEALGSPAGNYPTWRDMTGRPLARTDRRPRMISRQIYAYSVGYMLTGEPAWLERADAGVRWLLDHARDTEHGGWYPRLDATGAPLDTDPKTAQDTAYCGLGLAAWYFVTRDPEAEAALLDIRDLLFDPEVFWDAENGRIRDAVSFDLSEEVDVEDDGGWELVAQLDPINAFLLLVQPVLSEAARRDQALEDLQRLAQTLHDRFYADGIFWGVHDNKHLYGTKHVDFGHTLKSFWMLLQVDKRLPDHPFHTFLTTEVYDVVDRAYDAEYGRWANRPQSPTLVQYGSDWWIYAEADQLAMTLNLIDWRYTDRLAETQAHWLTDFVDTARPARELVPSIQRDGSPGWSWPDSDAAKCHEWKNGYHSSEHALVSYLLGRALEGREASLYFAVADPEGFEARPYVFDGEELGRTVLDEVEVGGRALTRVQVHFRDLY